MSVDEITDPATNTYRNWTTATIVFEKGPKGDDGQGIAGAVVRGPVKWESGYKTWNDGTVTESDGIRYIDVVYKDGTYYKCTDEHTQTNGFMSNYWDVASQFNFVATDLLLAPNAKIDFLTNQGLYLVDDDGTTVVGGAQGGQGINFWSGNSDPDSAAFKVDYQGNLTSTAGTIGGWTSNPGYLSGTSSFGGGSAGGTTTLNLTPGEVTGSISVSGGHGQSGPASTYNGTFSLTSGHLSFNTSNTSGDSNSVLLDYSGFSLEQTDGVTDDYISLSTAGLSITKDINGVRDSSATLTSSYLHVDSVSTDTIDTESLSSDSIVVDGRSVALSSGVIPFKIAIVTDNSSLFTVSGGEWYFNGTALGIYCGSGYTIATIRGDSWTIWDNSKLEFVDTGVYSTSVTRRGDTIYFEI